MLILQRLFLKEWISKYDEKDFYQWAIELNDLEQPIGTISAIKTDERVESVEIGYCIGKRFWNNGYMTEALTAIIRFFINEVGAGRVWPDMILKIQIQAR